MNTEHKDAEMRSPAGHTVLVPAYLVGELLMPDRGFEIVRYLDEPAAEDLPFDEFPKPKRGK